jgi:hypothetical protein
VFASRGAVRLTASEADAVGAWFVKTLMLHAHPAAHYTHPAIDRAALRWSSNEAPLTHYDWLVNRTPAPAGISLWVFRANEATDKRESPTYRVPLPVVETDQGVVPYVCFQMTLHGVNATVVVHPGWAINHPLEQAGEALRLFPHAGDGADLTALPVLGPRAVGWLRCRVTLRPGALHSPDLPPLEASSQIFAFNNALLPFVRGWGA